MDLLRALAIGALFGIGLYQLLRRNVIRTAIGLVTISNAVNLFLLSVGAYEGVAEAYAKAVGQRSDALPQALILTAIVISMGGFAFVLALLYVISTRYRTSDNDEVKGLRG
ncbi:MAG: sodium:proton antiporter [Thermoflexales bacterium]|nr:sodium:proton antiporter [Thermoflexales bacterium]MCS7324674.1 sodium:proton antiporter [Thermoflexales bacterium]MCX7939780.1 sodium:proton antiporter [Thermoflexales bacterium]MDW8053185.1 sodium:proton antiporter [Anaerolineae bacterium]MDW8291836.1 sodium:proton antiporter [Anaerolineae bacterium]